MKTNILQLGEEVLSADCKVTYKCVMSNGAAKVTEEASENCHDNAVCHQNADGESLCKCKEGFDGDGITECKSKCLLKGNNKIPRCRNSSKVQQNNHRKIPLHTNT